MKMKKKIIFIFSFKALRIGLEKWDSGIFILFFLFSFLIQTNSNTSILANQESVSESWSLKFQKSASESKSAIFFTDSLALLKTERGGLWILKLPNDHSAIWQRFGKNGYLWNPFFHFGLLKKLFLNKNCWK